MVNTFLDISTPSQKSKDHCYWLCVLYKLTWGEETSSIILIPGIQQRGSYIYINKNLHQADLLSPGNFQELHNHN